MIFVALLMLAGWLVIAVMLPWWVTLIAGGGVYGSVLNQAEDATWRVK